jgi:hypothetical protein
MTLESEKFEHAQMNVHMHQAASYYPHCKLLKYARSLKIYYSTSLPVLIKPQKCKNFETRHDPQNKLLGSARK